MGAWGKGDFKSGHDGTRYVLNLVRRCHIEFERKRVRWSAGATPDRGKKGGGKEEGEGNKGFPTK